MENQKRIKASRRGGACDLLRGKIRITLSALRGNRHHPNYYIVGRLRRQDSIRMLIIRILRISILLEVVLLMWEEALGTRGIQHWSLLQRY